MRTANCAATWRRGHRVNGARFVAGERLERHLKARSQSAQVVTAFGYQRQRTMSLRDAPQSGHDSAKAARRYAHGRQRIALVRVETRRYDQQFRRKLIDDWVNDRSIDQRIVPVVAPGLHRHVDREAFAPAGSDFVGCAGSRIERKLMG